MRASLVWIHSMGTRGGLAALALACSALGCGDKSRTETADAGVEDLTIVVEADKSRILQEEQALQQKRESFEKDRERLTKERSEIEQKLATLSKKDKRQRDELEAEQRRIETEDKRVRERAKAFETEREKLDAEKTKLLDRISKMTAPQAGLTIEQREQLVARRERAIAEREKAVAEREARVAEREAQAGRRIDEAGRVLADLQTSGGITKTVVVSNAGAAASAAPATRASAERSRRQVRARLEAKGLLLDDLPPATRTLYQNANKAFDEKDYASATESYNDIERVVDATVVNGDFIKAKMVRINRDIAQKAADESTQKQINALLAEVSDAMTEGRYDRANRKINQLVSLLAK